jgi:hypothetical protein
MRETISSSGSALDELINVAGAAGMGVFSLYRVGSGQKVTAVTFRRRRTL